MDLDGRIFVALYCVRSVAAVMIGGFGNAGRPTALIVQGACNLNIANSRAGNSDTGLAALLKVRRLCKILCSFPCQTDSWRFHGIGRDDDIELELVPQGNLAERIRVAGAGIGCVARIYTDLTVLDVTSGALVVLDIVPDCAFDER